MRYSFHTVLLRTTIMAAAALSLAACDHKDLDFMSGIPAGRARAYVVYDWRYSPNADPASMELCLYPEGASDHLSFNLQGKDGGEISLSPGHYIAISMNNDDLDWALYRNTNDKDDFEVYTHDASEFGLYQPLVSYLGATRAAWDERIASSPQMSWSTRFDDIEIREDGNDNIITLYPKEIVCHYSVEIRDVKNIETARGEVLIGSLSGMAEGYRHGSKVSTETPVTMPFQLVANQDSNVLTAEFLTFGECSSGSHDHSLGVYLFLDDGSVKEWTFDVTGQVTNAPDPTHVHIIVEGLDLPEDTNSGGLIPSVNDWNSEIIDINM